MEVASLIIASALDSVAGNAAAADAVIADFVRFASLIQ